MSTSEMEQSQVNETITPVVEKTTREIHFENLLGTLTLFKTQITTLQSQIKLLEKSINKEWFLRPGAKDNPFAHPVHELILWL